MNRKLENLCLSKLTGVPVLCIVIIIIICERYNINSTILVIENSFVLDWTMPVCRKHMCFEIIARLFNICLDPTHCTVVEEAIGNLEAGHLELVQILQSLCPNTIRLTYLFCYAW